MPRCATICATAPCWGWRANCGSAPPTAAAVESCRGCSAGGAWGPALVRDADVALAGLPRAPQGQGRDVVLVKTHSGVVTAACAAQETGEVFLGFEDGVLAHFNPRHGAVTTWQPNRGEVVALAVDRGARVLVVVRQQGAHGFEVASFQALGASYTLHNRWALEAAVAPRLTPLACLTPLAFGNAGCMMGVWDGRDLMFVSVPDLVTVDRMKSPTAAAALILDGWRQDNLAASTVVFKDDPLSYSLEMPAISSANRGEAEERPCLPLPSFAATPLRQGGSPLFSWLLLRRTHLELAYPDPAGVLHWLCLRVLTDNPAVVCHHQTGASYRYRCAALLQPGRAAGVHRDGVSWLSCGERGFLFRAETQAGLADAVACFASPLTKELLVVSAGGDILRAPAPW